jgi:hypothetical protein
VYAYISQIQTKETTGKYNIRFKKVIEPIKWQCAPTYPSLSVGTGHFLETESIHNKINNKNSFRSLWIAYNLVYFMNYAFRIDKNRITLNLIPILKCSIIFIICLCNSHDSWPSLAVVKRFGASCVNIYECVCGVVITLFIYGDHFLLWRILDFMG